VRYLEVVAVDVVEDVGKHRNHQMIQVQFEGVDMRMDSGLEGVPLSRCRTLPQYSVGSSIRKAAEVDWVGSQG